MKPASRKVLAIAICAMLIAVGAAGCGSGSLAATEPAQTTLTTQTPSTRGAGTSDSTATATLGATRTITNLDGSTIEVPAQAQRVACLFGPSYEKVVLLGCEDKIIADGDFHIDGWPWSNVVYKRLNEVPGVPNAHDDLNLEELVKMGPDRYRPRLAVNAERG